MTDITNLIGTTIAELQLVPAVTSTTRLPVQRVGVDTAEAATLENIDTYLDVTNKILTAVADHEGTLDAHGDRAYSNVQLNTHKQEIDAHGHKVYTDAEVLNHSQSTDPHGDRLYSYNILQTHKNISDAHGHETFTTQEISTHDQSSNAHNITNRINTAISSLSGVEGGFPPLSNNLTIPSVYLPVTTQPVEFVYGLPTTGIADKIYVLRGDDKQYYWDGVNWQELSSFDVGGLSFTTNDVPESSTSPDLNRRYFTSGREATINAAISARLNGGSSVGSGEAVYKEKIGSTLYFKTLVAGDGIEVVSGTNSITISKIVESVIEEEPIDFSLQARTYEASVIDVMTTDGLALDTIGYTNVLKFPVEGLTQYTGRIVMAKVKQGSGLSQVGKYNITEEVRTWKVSTLIKSYTDWTSTGDDTFATIIATDIVEDLMGTGTNTTATFVVSIDVPTRSVLITVTSPADLNYVYLWKATFKKTYIDHTLDGTIEHD